MIRRNTALPDKVRIVEVGPRDGLQNEKLKIDVLSKVRLVEMLVSAGLTYVEAGSFVNPKWVPQMADSDDLFVQLNRWAGATYAALTPNLQGFERALAVGANEVAVFASASEEFSQNNINCSIEDSLKRFTQVMDAANESGIAVRGYLSCVVGCPYQGAVPAADVLRITEQMLALGCYEVSLGDTIGVGTPGSVNTMLDTVMQNVSPAKLAVHCHDTYGMATANVYAALLKGITVVDSSVAGLGGCPYARGASGNVATEDIVYLLDGLGIEHGVSLDKLMRAGDFINTVLKRRSNSRVALAKKSRSNKKDLAH